MKVAGKQRKTKITVERSFGTKNLLEIYAVYVADKVRGRIETSKAKYKMEGA